MDFFLTDDQRLIRDAVRQLGESGCCGMVMRCLWELPKVNVMRAVRCALYIVFIPAFFGVLAWNVGHMLPEPRPLAHIGAWIGWAVSAIAVALEYLRKPAR